MPPNLRHVHPRMTRRHSCANSGASIPPTAMTQPFPLYHNLPFPPFPFILFLPSLLVVTSGHVTKMAVTPLDPPCPKPNATRKPHGAIIPVLWAIEVYIAGKGIIDLSYCCDLDLEPMTFINELYRYSREIHCMRKYALATSRLSKAIV